MQGLTLRSTLSLLTALLLLSPLDCFAAQLKGKLKTTTPSNYKIVAINKDGGSKLATVSPSGNFSVVVKKGSTLHLVQTAGKYFGPIVSAKGKKAYTTTSGKSGSLGAVSVKNGFATVSFAKTKNFIQAKPSVLYNASTGPKGAGKLGLVATSTSQFQALAEGDYKLGEDGDKDGLPGIIDVDDDGDSILDVQDNTDGTEDADFNVELTSRISTDFKGSLNVNIGSVSDAQLDALVQDSLGFELRVNNQKEGNTLTAVNVDCQSISYCAKGNGTATITTRAAGVSENSAWTAYDPDGDTFPNLLIRDEPNIPDASITIRANTTRALLRAGDTVFFNLDTNKGIITQPLVLPFYFVTVPALKEYSSGGTTSAVTYPISENAPGTSALNPLTMAGTTLTLTFWKPQRETLDGESGDFIDMGNLIYGVLVSPQGSSNPIACALSDFTNLSGTLTPNSGGLASAARAVVDSAADATPSSANTLNFTLDVGACLTRHGMSTSGTKFMIDLTAATVAGDESSQQAWFQLP